MDNDFAQASSASQPIDGGTPRKKKKSPITPLLRTFRRKALVIAACFGSATAVAWMLTADDLPTYGGSFQMLVEPVTSEARVSEPSALTRGDEKQDELDYPTQLELLQSPKVLWPIYQEIVEKYPAFTYLDLRANLLIERTGGKVRSNQTKILMVSYREYDPELVQMVLTKLAEKYLSYSLEDRRTRIGEGVKFIDDQLPNLQNRVNQLQEQLERLQQQYDLVDPASQGGVVFSNLRSIADKQDANNREFLELRTLYTTLQQQLQLNPNEAIAASALSQDPRYQQVLSAISQIESQVATESARFSEESPVIQRLRERQANLGGLLNRESQRILGQTLGNTQRNPQSLTFQDSVRVGLIQQLVNARNQLQVLETRSQALARTRAKAEQEAAQFPDVARRYNEIQRQLNIATRTLDQLQIQRETLRVEAAQSQVPWEIVSPPVLPTDEKGNPIPDPLTSRKKLMAGIVGGLVIGLGLALLIEKLQNKLYTAKDVEDLVPAPMLGVLPRYNGAEPVNLGAMAPELVQELDPSAFPFLDAFSLLYANMCFEYPVEALRSLIICSPTAGDGKTTTALYLAQTAAGVGRRVLLVDANLRNPQLHARLGLSNEKGLSDVLRQNQTSEAAIQRSPGVETLSVLTAGSTPRGASQLLASPQMKRLMDSLETEFDLIIYDTPSFNKFIDASFIAANAHGILLVNAVRQTSRSAAVEALKKVQEYRLNILGAVANSVKQGRVETEWEEEEEVQEFYGDEYEPEEPAEKKNEIHSFALEDEPDAA